MSLRRRLAIGAAIAVAVAVVAASLSAYLVTSTRLHDDVDTQLVEQARRALRDGRIDALPGGPLGRDRHGRDRVGGAPLYAQIVTSSGSARSVGGEPAVLPVSDDDRAVADGSHPTYLWDADVRGVSLRGITTPIGDGTALAIARPVDEINSVLSGMRIILLIVTGAGILLGGALAWFITGRALRPVTDFTEETEGLAEAGDLSRRLPEGGDDEIGRLARVFNGTLDQLESSADAQRRLVADASHELRTPLASLRANIEVLQQPGTLPPEDHEALLRDVVEQTDELAALVTDIVHAGETDVPVEEAQDVRLDEITVAAIERIQRLTPGTTVLQDLAPTVVDGVPERLNRLVANLLDNAVKWSPAGQSIEVTLRDDVLTVRDHGPGFAEADLPHVFDRFYRSTDARGMPGSGLGLSIVRQVAEMHGATATAGNAPGGGAIMTITFSPSADA